MKKVPLPRLDIFCTHDELRPVMNCIFIDKEYAVSSDANILIKMKVSDHFQKIEKADQKLIHRSVWFQMLWANERICTDEGITCHYNNYKCTFNYEKDGKYPLYMKILQLSYETASKKSLTDVILMPWNIERFSKLDRNSPVRFYFTEEQKAIFIQSEYYHGLLMPCINTNNPNLELKSLEDLFKEVK